MFKNAIILLLIASIIISISISSSHVMILYFPLYIKFISEATPTSLNYWFSKK